MAKWDNPDISAKSYKPTHDWHNDPKHNIEPKSDGPVGTAVLGESDNWELRWDTDIYLTLDNGHELYGQYMSEKTRLTFEEWLFVTFSDAWHNLDKAYESRRNGQITELALNYAIGTFVGEWSDHVPTWYILDKIDELEQTLN